MKKPVKVYLESATEFKLKKKAVEAGFVGRGNLTRFLEKIASEPIVFLDGNTKALLQALNLKTE